MAFGLVSTALAPLKALAAPILGTSATAAAPLGAAATVVGAASALPVVGDVLGAALSPVTDLLGVTGGGPIDLTGWSGGNGQTVTRTTIETMDVNTGKIIRIKRHPGTPYLMNNDVAAAKKVIRRSGQLNKRLPRKTVRESPATQLSKAAIAAAIRQANKDGECCK